MQRNSGSKEYEGSCPESSNLALDKQREAMVKMNYFLGVYLLRSVTVVTPDGSGNAVLFSSIYTHYKYFLPNRSGDDR